MADNNNQNQIGRPRRRFQFRRIDTSGDIQRLSNAINTMSLASESARRDRIARQPQIQEMAAILDTLQTNREALENLIILAMNQMRRLRDERDQVGINAQALYNADIQTLQERLQVAQRFLERQTENTNAANEEIVLLMTMLERALQQGIIVPPNEVVREIQYITPPSTASPRSQESPQESPREMSPRRPGTAVERTAVMRWNEVIREVTLKCTWQQLPDNIKSLFLVVYDITSPATQRMINRNQELLLLNENFMEKINNNNGCGEQEDMITLDPFTTIPYPFIFKHTHTPDVTPIITCYNMESLANYFRIALENNENEIRLYNTQLLVEETFINDIIQRYTMLLDQLQILENFVTSLDVIQDEMQIDSDSDESV